MGADDVDGFLDAAALGDDVLDDEHFFARRNFEAAAQDEFAILFFHKYKAGLELAGDFLAEDEPTHGRRNDGGGAERTNASGKRGAEFFNGGHLLERDGALEELPAVQAAAKEEMAFEQRAGVAEDLQHFVFGHGDDSSFKDERGKGKIMEPLSPALSPPCGAREKMQRSVF